VKSEGHDLCRTLSFWHTINAPAAVATVIFFHFWYWIIFQGGAVLSIVGGKQRPLPWRCQRSPLCPAAGASRLCHCRWLAQRKSVLAIGEGPTGGQVLQCEASSLRVLTPRSLFLPVPFWDFLPINWPSHSQVWLSTAALAHASGRWPLSLHAFATSWAPVLLPCSSLYLSASIQAPSPSHLRPPERGSPGLFRHLQQGHLCPPSFSPRLRLETDPCLVWSAVIL
jgi:hypothetical protein